MSRSEKKFGCVSCGDELHPERAAKYNYCLKPECQAKNLKGLTMVAVGVNKSAEQYLLLDEDTQAELARGQVSRPAARHLRPARAGPGPPRTASPAEPAPDGPATAGPALASPATASTATASTAGTSAARATPVKPAPVSPRPPRLPGTASQRRLAVLYNQQGLRPDEIARKLGLSRYDVTQIILAARSRGKS